MRHVYSPPQSSTTRHTLILAGLPVLLAFGMVGSPVAQSTPGGSAEPRGAHPGMHRLLGPVSPEFLRDSIGVSGAKLDQYTKQYQNYIAQTRPTRDSLQSAMGSIRSAYESGDRAAARDRRRGVRQQAEQLMKQDREFDARLKDILTPDQQKRYSEWKERRIKLGQEQRHRGRRQHGERSSASRDSVATFSDSAGS